MTQRIFLLAVFVFFGSLMPSLPALAQETLKKPSEMPKPLLAPVVGHRGFSYDFPKTQPSPLPNVPKSALMAANAT